jgi:cytochrome c oxidase assembly protein subunit 11
MTVRRTAGVLTGVAAGMLALSFAAVPLYDLFCRVTGYGGQTMTAGGTLPEVSSQTIRVRFDASTGAGMPWAFSPETREMDIRLGETGIAFYVATNPLDRATGGTATFNVTPYAAGQYFTKIDCFCFTEQVLEPGRTARMPVTFYVDPAILDDPEARGIDVITLSYTFYEAELPEGYEAAEALQSGANPVN